MLEIAIMAKLDVIDVALALWSWSITFGLEPQLCHFFQSLLCHVQVLVLHELETTEKMSVWLIFLVDFVNNIVVDF